MSFFVSPTEYRCAASAAQTARAAKTPAGIRLRDSVLSWRNMDVNPVSVTIVDAAGRVVAQGPCEGITRSMKLSRICRVKGRFSLMVQLEDGRMWQSQWLNY